jgi:two-component system, NtrC family, sensor histidine kinase HydH
MMALFKKERIAYASPWLLAAAIGLLVFIIFVFTVSNLRRAQRLVDENLLHKGQDLVRFVGAGTRASTLMGPEPGQRIQQLMEQAAVEEDILYLAVIDGEGRIVAHSNPEAVGSEMVHDFGAMQDIARGNGYRIRRQTAEPGMIFEVISPFRPFEGRHGKHRRLRQAGIPAPEESGGSCDPRRQPAAVVRGVARMERPGGEWWRLPAAGEQATPSHLMLVGLDMSEQAKLVRQDRFQLLLMSLLLLLVGIGGWFSLMVAQGYQVSQKTLRHIRAFTGQLISRLPVGVVATGPDGLLRTCNQAAASITGKEHPAESGLEPQRVLPLELAAYLGNGSEDDGVEVLDREVDISGGKGECLVEVSSVPIRDEDETFMGRVLLFCDVTGQRRLERQLRRQERFVALGKMAAGVAHEVRNPLSSIKGFATLLGGKFPQGSKEAEAAQLLIREVERLNRAITELLDFARPLPLQTEILEIGKLMRDSLELVSTDARALGIDITIDIPAGLPALQVDPDRFNQVLLNLYLNAMQAMEKGGRLLVTAGVDPDGSSLVVTIEDTGCGIPSGNLDRIFDPYFTTKPAGTGLGLAMVQKIMEEHGGQIHITSLPDSGTKVILSLPVPD